MSEREYIRIPQKYGDEEIDVICYKSPPLDAPKEWPLDGCGMFPPLDQRSFVQEGVLVDRDVEVTLRDGVKIYVDVHRPVGEAGEEDLPAILAWSNYGKRANGGENAFVPGVPEGAVSNMTKFEGPDPVYWCARGYAIINTDGRGCGNSEGNQSIWSDQDGRDGYDVVEWAAAQPWSNGRVGMAGNSSLAISQWYVAAEQPPHLACIAPWEGLTDMFREFVTNNGIPAPGFVSFVYTIFRGPGYIDDPVAMLSEYPFINGYWKSHMPRLEDVKVPAYVCAGWSHIHLLGTLNAWRRISSENKWLRIHREFEWPDAYAWQNMEDLRRFFDRYLKGVRNGWEATPPVRLEVMDAYDHDFQVNRPEREYPPARTEYRKLYLDAANAALSPAPVASVSKAAYDATEGETAFDITFDEDTEITGSMKVRLWVETEGHDEMDLFVTVMKLDENGEWLPTLVMGLPHPGAPGNLRVSRRELDEELSTDIQPVQAHRSEQKLKPGEVVPVDIAIYPTSKIWHKGQRLRLRIAGRYIRENWFEPFAWATDNAGQHVVHTGGEYDSFLQIPVVPPKYEAGEYRYR